MAIHISNKVKRGSYLNFDINNIDVGFLNAIRRTMIADIPNVAMKFDSYHPENTDAKILKNTSVLHNEFTYHRLSLLPLCFDETEIENFDPSKYKFVIEEKGEKFVTSKDIKIYDESGVIYPEAFREKIFPADPITKKYILITLLKDEKEELHVEFYGSKDVARTHARWSPISTCTYFNNLDNDLIKKEKSKIDLSDNVALNKFDTIDKYRLFKKNEFNEPNSFNMTIESECRLSPKYIFNKAITVIQKKLGDIISNTKIETIDIDTHLYVLYVDNEDNTLGNLIQVHVFNKYVRNNELVDFIGYFQPHPLENKITFKIRFLQQQSVIEFLETIVEDISKLLDDIKM